MKSFYLVLSFLLLFVVYTTRMDISIKKIFSEKAGIEFSDSDNGEDDTDEKSKEECKANHCNEFYFENDNQNIGYYHPKQMVVDAHDKLKHPSLSIDAPPPKG